MKAKSLRRTQKLTEITLGDTLFSTEAGFFLPESVKQTAEKGKIFVNEKE
jgi:hypothetical protein